MTTLPVQINNGTFLDDPSADTTFESFNKTKTIVQWSADRIDGIDKIEALARVAYDALTPDVNTLYIVDEGATISVYKGTLGFVVTSPYKQSFVAADWTAQQITVLAATHGKGTDPKYYIKDNTNRVVDVDAVFINNAGDVIITTIPGSEFDGTIIIS